MFPLVRGWSRGNTTDGCNLEFLKAVVMDYYFKTFNVDWSGFHVIKQIYFRHPVRAQLI